MKATSRESRFVLLLGLCGIIIGALSLPCLGCFTVVVGKDASAHGCVLMAHNEDDGPPQIVNHHKLPRSFAVPGEKVQLRNGGIVDAAPCNWAVIWSEMPGMQFSDSYVNEWGVAITSDNCPSRENKPSLTEGGIGFMLRRLVAYRARSAREGVILAGELIERFGYVASGRSYIISDPQEAWILCVVQGKHWIAQRVGDDEVAVVANTYTVGEVDIADSTTVLASDDIVRYARQRGWYDPQKDGAFNFAQAYASPGSATHPSNLGRQWQGLAYIAGDHVSYGPSLPFSIKPDKKLGVTDLMRILRRRQKSVTETVSSPLEPCPPQGSCQICSNATQTSFVAQLGQGKPADINLVYWVCLAPPETSFFIPFFFGMPQFPAGYAKKSERPSKAVFDHSVAAPFKADPFQAFWTFSNFREKYKETSVQTKTRISSEAKAVEDWAMRLSEPMATTAEQIYSTDRKAAMGLLANFSHGIYLSALEAMKRVSEQSPVME